MQRTKRALLMVAAAVGVLVALALADTTLGGRVARAETVEAKRSAEVFASPGEQSRVVTHVRAGKKMVVLAHKNRWLKVRVNGRTGWITRTNTVTPVLTERAPRRVRHRPFVEGRSTRRGARGRRAPSDREGADATDEGFIDEDGGGDDATLKHEREVAERKRRRAMARDRKREERADRADDRDEGDRDSDEGISDDGADDRDDGEDPGDEGGDVDSDDGADTSDADSHHDSRETVVVASATHLYQDASSKSERLDRAHEGDKLFVVQRDGSWIKVENEGGEVGWVRAADVETTGYHYPKLSKRVSAQLGYSAMSQSFTSDSSDATANYTLSSGAMVLGLGGEATYNYSAKYLLGADLHYHLLYASPGIHYTDPGTMQSVNIGFKDHVIDLGGRAGYKLSSKNGMAAYGRLGFHYEHFGIDNVGDFTKNLARLPTEVLSGVTIGAMLDVPRLTDRFSGRIGLDALALLASRKQTAGLEDGASSSAFALWATASVVYDWKPDWKLTGQYEYAYAKTSWTGMATASMRPQMATKAERKDGTHVFMFGLYRPF